MLTMHIIFFVLDIFWPFRHLSHQKIINIFLGSKISQIQKNVVSLKNPKFEWFLRPNFTLCTHNLHSEMVNQNMPAQNPFKKWSYVLQYESSYLMIFRASTSVATILISKFCAEVAFRGFLWNQCAIFSRIQRQNYS